MHKIPLDHLGEKKNCKNLAKVTIGLKTTTKQKASLFLHKVTLHFICFGSQSQIMSKKKTGKGEFFNIPSNFKHQPSSSFLSACSHLFPMPGSCILMYAFQSSCYRTMSSNEQQYVMIKRILVQTKEYSNHRLWDNINEN